VDGLSSDNTREIVRGLMEEDPRVKLLTNPQEKISSGRNTGLKASKAEYVAYLDGHTFVGKDWLETLISTFKNCKKKYNLAGIGSTYASPEDDSPFGKTVAYCIQTVFGGLGTSFTEEKEIHPVETVAFALYKRSILENEGIIYDEKMTHCEDTDFNHQLVKKGYILLKHPKALVYQYRRKNIMQFSKQMIKYGEGRYKLVKKYSETLRYYHLFPVIAIFYLLLVLISLFIFIFNQINLNNLIIILIPLFLYILIDVIYTILIMTKNRSLKNIYALIIFPAVHIGYGIGFLKGLILTKS
jgi:cellulose synthase/poly-beta-1,6-N-acetylglucosamine synthase-like glycosyltransferase